MVLGPLFAQSWYGTSGTSTVSPDEPGAGLNSSEKVELRDLLKRISARGLTILIIDHDMTLVSEVAQHITVLNFGRRIADGYSADVLKHPDVIAAYLGTGPDAAA